MSVCAIKKQSTDKAYYKYTTSYASYIWVYYRTSYAAAKEKMEIKKIACEEFTYKYNTYGTRVLLCKEVYIHL